MKVLLSIKPEFAAKIFDGSKKYEYRRVIFKNPLVNTVVVFASSPTSMIIGEFEIESIIYDKIPVLWELRRDDHPSASEKAFFEYFSGKSSGYAIKIKSPIKYPTLRSLSSVTSASPPQSFVYLLD